MWISILSVIVHNLFIIVPYVKSNDHWCNLPVPDSCRCRLRHHQYTLDCTNSNMTSIPTITSSTTWYEINFENNKINLLIKCQFIKLYVKRLNLKSNYLIRIQESTFKDIIGLNDLILSSNNLTKIQSEIFVHTPDLSTLDLSNNPFEYLDIDSLLEQLKSSLEILYLRNISSINKSIISNKFIYGSNLKYLDLSFNDLKSLNIDMFNSMINLETLILNENKLKDLNGLIFQKLTNLINVKLDHNELIELPIIQSNSIKILSLEENLIQSLTLFALVNMTNLTSLDLDKNQLSTIYTHTFCNTSLKLDLISMDSNQFQTLSYCSLNMTTSENLLYSLRKNERLICSCDLYKAYRQPKHWTIDFDDCLLPPLMNKIQLENLSNSICQNNITCEIDCMKTHTQILDELKQLEEEEKKRRLVNKQHGQRLNNINMANIMFNSKLFSFYLIIIIIRSIKLNLFV